MHGVNNSSDLPGNTLLIPESDFQRQRMIEISENLHRAELTALERGRLVKEWAELVGESVSAQLAQKLPQGGRPVGGTSEAARQLGLDRDAVRRCVKIASLSPEAQAVAVERMSPLLIPLRCPSWRSTAPCPGRPDHTVFIPYRYPIQTLSKPYGYGIRA